MKKQNNLDIRIKQLLSQNNMQQGGIQFNNMTRTREEDEAARAVQKPIFHIQTVQTSEPKGNGSLQPGSYNKVYYTDPNQAKIENQDFEYVDDSGMESLKRMRNYQLYLEKLNQSRNKPNQDMAVMQYGGTSFNTYGAFNKQPQPNNFGLPQYNFDYNFDNYTGEGAQNLTPAETQGMGDMYMAANQPAASNPLASDAQNYYKNNPPLFSTEMQNTAPEVENEKQDRPDDFQLFNPYSSVDIPTAAYTLGQGIENGNGLETFGSALKLATGLGRNIFSGIGNARVNNYTKDEYDRKMRERATQPEYMQQGGKIQNADLLTGHYLTDQGQGSVEVEGDEHVKHPDGKVQEVVGEGHEKNGVKVDLENGTKVLSDFTKIGAKNAEIFRETFDIKAKATDTFAKILDKVNAKIGLDKKIEEEKKLLLKTEKIIKEEDGDTQDLNAKFLSEELQRVQAEKAPLEAQQQAAFEVIFEKQELIPKKSPDGKNILQEGGEVEALSKQYGIPEDRIRELLQQTKMQYGGRVGNKFEDPKKFVHQQEHGNGYYGDILLGAQQQDVIAENARLHPELYSQFFNENQYTPKDTKAFQTAVNQKYEGILKDAATLYGVDSPQYKGITAQMEKDKFLPDASVRGIEGKFGNYSSTRPNFELQVLPREDLERVRAEGINTAGQLKAKYPDLHKKYVADKNLASDFWLGEIPNSNLSPSVTPAPTDTTTVEVEKNINTDNPAWGFPLFPNQEGMLPSPVSPVYKANVALDRISPTKVSIEPNLVEAQRQMAGAQGTLAGLSPQQAAAAMAQMMAGNTGATNAAISAAEAANAGAVQQADAYNAQVAGKENILNNDAALSYEARILGGMANYEANLNRFFNHSQAVNKQNWMDVNNLNLLNQMSDNYKTDGSNVIRTADDPIFVKPIDNPNTGSVAEQYARSMANTKMLERQMKAMYKKK